MGKGSRIINTVSVDVYIGPPIHLGYAVIYCSIVTLIRAVANRKGR